MNSSHSLPSRCRIRLAKPEERWEIFKWLNYLYYQELGWQRAIGYLIFLVVGIPIIAVIGSSIAWRLSGADIAIEPSQIFKFCLQILIVSPITALITIISAASFFSRSRWGRLWLVECNGSLVGYANLIHNNNYSILSRLYIVPNYRRQGIGSYFVQHLATEAVRPLYILCTPNLLRFYTRLGFIRVFDRSIPQELRLGIRFGLTVLYLR